MKIDYGKNLLFALVAPAIHLAIPSDGQSVEEIIWGCIIVYVLCYGLMCASDASIEWIRKKIHGADARTD